MKIMDNDKWLCTAKVYQSEDGGYKLVLSSKDGITDPKIAVIIQTMFEQTMGAYPESKDHLTHRTPPPTHPASPEQPERHTKELTL